MKFVQSSKSLQWIIAAIALVVAAPQVLAQDAGTRVAVVNSEKVFNESNLAKAMQTRLQNEFTKRQNDLRDSAQKIQTAAEKLDRDAAVMNEAERVRRQRELADQDRELQRKQREFTEDLNQRTFEERAKIAEKANAVLRQIAEQRKLDIIVQEAAFVSPKADITDDVIKALNSQK
jgi:outer membrane protein